MTSYFTSRHPYFHEPKASENTDYDLPRAITGLLQCNFFPNCTLLLLL